MSTFFPQLYHFSKRFLGIWLTERFLKATVFGQFAGGLDEAEVKKVVCKLAQRKISSIVFFSIERDLE